MAMAAVRAILMTFIIATTLVNITSAITGTAVYRSYNISGLTSCGYGPEQGPMVASVSIQNWNRDEDCGKFYRVRCTGNTGAQNPCKEGEITVKIVDFCPGCPSNQLELSEQAFSMIADPFSGRVDIEYFPV